jgi:hypothetical protein
MKAEQITQHWYNPEVQRAVLWSVVLGGLSSTAAAIMVHHIEPSENLRKEVLTATAFGAATTVASIAWKLYTIERDRLKA